MNPLHQVLLMAVGTIAAVFDGVGRVSVELRACPKPSVAPGIDQSQQRAYCQHNGRRCRNLQIEIKESQQIVCKASNPVTRKAPGGNGIVTAGAGLTELIDSAAKVNRVMRYLSPEGKIASKLTGVEKIIWSQFFRGWLRTHNQSFNFGIFFPTKDLQALMRKGAPYPNSILEVLTNPDYQDEYGPIGFTLYPRSDQTPISRPEVQSELPRLNRDLKEAFPALTAWYSTQVDDIIRKYQWEKYLLPPKKDEVTPGKGSKPTPTVKLVDKHVDASKQYVQAWRKSKLRPGAFLIREFGQIHVRFIGSWQMEVAEGMAKSVSQAVKRLFRGVGGSDYGTNRLKVSGGAKVVGYVVATYGITQALLRAEKVRSIKLYRGVGGELADELLDRASGSSVRLRARPLSSWTSSRIRALEFARLPGGTSVLLQTTFPAHRVFSFYKLFTRVGSEQSETARYEKEYIIMGHGDIVVSLKVV